MPLGTLLMQGTWVPACSKVQMPCLLLREPLKVVWLTPCLSLLPCSNLQSTGLSGDLPLDNGVWGPLNTVQNLNLADNSIHGYVPPELNDLTGLQSLQLQNNQLQGPLPDLSSSLQSIDVANNQLTGGPHEAASPAAGSSVWGL